MLGLKPILCHHTANRYWRKKFDSLRIWRRVSISGLRHLIPRMLTTCV